VSPISSTTAPVIATSIGASSPADIEVVSEAGRVIVELLVGSAGEKELGPVAAGVVVCVAAAPGAAVASVGVLDGVAIALGAVAVAISVADAVLRLAWVAPVVVVVGCTAVAFGVVTEGVVSGGALVLVIAGAVVRFGAGATGWYAVMRRRSAEAGELPGADVRVTGQIDVSVLVILIHC